MGRWLGRWLGREWEVGKEDESRHTQKKNREKKGDGTVRGNVSQVSRAYLSTRHAKKKTVSMNEARSARKSSVVDLYGLAYAWSTWYARHTITARASCMTEPRAAGPTTNSPTRMKRRNISMSSHLPWRRGRGGEKVREGE